MSCLCITYCRTIVEMTHDVVNNCTQLSAERCGHLKVRTTKGISTVHRKGNCKVNFEKNKTVKTGPERLTPEVQSV